jgi:1,4-alpha-glucan branching enzyme
LNEIDPNAILIAEAPTETSKELMEYYGNGDEFHGAFHFRFHDTIMETVKQGKRMPNFFQDLLFIQNNIPPGTTDILFLSNHDHFAKDRVASQLNGFREKIKMAASLYILLSGIPSIYYGEEIGMTGAGSDDALRRNMEWNSVNNQINDRSSILNHYRRLLKLRQHYTPLSLGKTVYIPTHSDGRWDSSNQAFPYISLMRKLNFEKMIVIHGLDNTRKPLHLNLNAFDIQPASDVHVIMGTYEGINYDKIYDTNQGFYPTKQQFSLTSKILLIGNVDKYRGKDGIILTYENALEWKPRDPEPIPSPRPIPSVLPIPSPRVSPVNSSRDTIGSGNPIFAVFALILLLICIVGLFLGIMLSIVIVKYCDKKESERLNKKKGIIYFDE